KHGRVTGSKLLLVQLDPHRDQLLTETPPAGAGSHLAELRSVADIGGVDKCRDDRFRSSRRTEYRRREGGPHLVDPAFPAGVIHGGQHRHVGGEADEQRRRRFATSDDERGPAFFEGFDDRLQRTGNFWCGYHFELDGTV